MKDDDNVAWELGSSEFASMLKVKAQVCFALETWAN